MSDRELRDEVEALFGELKRERQKVEAPLDVELAHARTALITEIAELTTRAQTLRERREALGTQREDHERETRVARAQLAEARAEIARREPLGNPLTESRSNWETGEPGCAVGLWLVLCVGSGAAWWWLQ
jgi:chromosome segregation ATPase